MSKKLPDDFKIEHDRLVHEMNPIASRIFQLMQELPEKCNEENIFYDGFTINIKKEKET